MNLPEFETLLDNKALLSGISVVIDAFIGNLVAVIRNRVKTLDYTVTAGL